MPIKHTPAPWYAVGYWVEHPDDDTPDIANCNPADMGQEGRSDKEIVANTRLIAAAPELLEIAKGLDALSHQCKTQGLSSLLAKAHAAIAKTTGEQA